jgi:hypothetical protein
VAHWAAIPVSGVISFAAGFLFALPVLRLGTMHLAMATFAVGAVVPILAKYKGIEQWTGGGQGMGLDVPAVPFGLPLSFLINGSPADPRLADALIRAGGESASRSHRPRSDRDPRPSIAAQATGIDMCSTRRSFGISAMLAGIAGALAVLAIRHVGPGCSASLSLWIPDWHRRRHRLLSGASTARSSRSSSSFTGTTARVLQTWNLWLIRGDLVLTVSIRSSGATEDARVPAGQAGLIGKQLLISTTRILLQQLDQAAIRPATAFRPR